MGLWDGKLLQCEMILQLVILQNTHYTLLCNIIINNDQWGKPTF